jgi:receptor expression-enhancing protein 5/6
MHPQLELAISKIDEFMVAHPMLSQYGASPSLVSCEFAWYCVANLASLASAFPLFSTDRLADIEKKTGYPKAAFFSLIVAFIVSIISLLGGMKLISDLIGFVYPAYMSFKAIESAGNEDDVQWLTYWVVFATFSIAESTIMFVLDYIPFYFIVKSVFMAWLFHPKFMGAALVYKQVK